MIKADNEPKNYTQTNNILETWILPRIVLVQREILL